MYKEYLLLQSKRSWRWLREQGIHPFLSIPLGIAALAFGIVLLFEKTEKAPWILAAIALSWSFSFLNHERKQSLTQMFGNRSIKNILRLELSLLLAPFVLIELIQGAYTPALILGISALSLPEIPSKPATRRALPTPFAAWPHEFIIGFRRTFLLLGICLLLYIPAFQVENPNLALFAFISIQLCMLTYHLQPEPLYYVWMYHRSASEFLKKKIGHALLANSLISIPCGLLLATLFPSIWPFALALLVLGYLAQVLMVLCKYSAYPREMGLTQGIWLSVSIALPPLMLLFIPFFFNKAKAQLEEILP